MNAKDDERPLDLDEILRNLGEIPSGPRAPERPANGPLLCAPCRAGQHVTCEGPCGCSCPF